MPLMMPGDVKQEGNGVKCRIPTRSPARPKPLQNKPKLNPEPQKSRMENAVNQHQQRISQRNSSRPQSNERPKSANRLKDELGLQWTLHAPPNSGRPDRERLLPAIKRPSTLPRRVAKEQKPIIAVPMSQRQTAKFLCNAKNGLPDQETISKREDLEINGDESSELSDVYPNGPDYMSKNRNLAYLKTIWQENSETFEKMKNDLKAKQQAIIEHYASLRNTHQLLLSMGHKTNLPSSDDLRIMNVARLTPEQLLELCANAPTRRPYNGAHNIAKKSETIDMGKLYNMPAKLTATCQEALEKRKEMIDWFEAAKAEGKGIQLNVFTKKLNDFSAENESLKVSLEQAKADFLKELNEVVEFMRTGVNETMTLQLRVEDLTYKLSELHSENSDLKKQIHNVDHVKASSLKMRIEELEKDLKEERCKKAVIRDQLKRAQCQGNMAAERESQLRATLEQAQSQAWSLERTVQQLHEQNEHLQLNFDKELIKLTDSIRENTMHLEEIAEDREKLQQEKEDLESRLKDLSENYNESLKIMKEDIAVNVTKIVETEKKYEQEVEANKKLQTQLESLCAQVLETELAKKDALKRLQEKEEELSKNKSCQNELETAKRDLERAVMEIEDYRMQFIKQREVIKEIERNFKESAQVENNLKATIATKEAHIGDLEKAQAILEKQLQESEAKMESYEKQLYSLKSHITQLKNDFGDFEDLNELHKIVNQQLAQQIDVAKQNEELSDVLRKKDKDLERHLISLREQERLLEQRENIIKILSEKEEEQANIIKLLKSNLEIRTQTDIDLNKQLSEKNAQINSLVTNVETRKQQICQLEKIILTLEEQKRKAHFQRKKDQEIIRSMEQKIFEYESLQAELKSNTEGPAHLDSIIKLLEDELRAPYELELINGEHELVSAKQKRRNYDEDSFEYHNKTKNNKTIFVTNNHENDPVPTKIVMGNFVKKTYMPVLDDQHSKNDGVGRKNAIKPLETTKWIADSENDNIQTSPVASYRGGVRHGINIKENLLTKNIKHQMRDEKKLEKLFKLTSHNL